MIHGVVGLGRELGRLIMLWLRDWCVSRDCRDRGRDRGHGRGGGDDDRDYEVGSLSC